MRFNPQKGSFAQPGLNLNLAQEWIKPAIARSVLITFDRVDFIK